MAELGEQFNKIAESACLSSFFSSFMNSLVVRFAFDVSGFAFCVLRSAFCVWRLACHLSVVAHEGCGVVVHPPDTSLPIGSGTLGVDGVRWMSMMDGLIQIGGMIDDPYRAPSPFPAFLSLLPLATFSIHAVVLGFA